jgi:hypothetical protein
MTDIGIYNDTDRAKQAYWNMTTEEKLALAEENNAALIARFSEVAKGNKLVEYAHDYAKIDGVIVGPEGKIVGIYEAKTRVTDAETLLNGVKLGNEWVVNLDKIEAGIEMADMQRIPFYGINYCTVDKALITVKIYHDGKLLAPYVAKRTVTSAGTLGGGAERNNAYVNLENAKVHRAEASQ